MYLVRKNLKTMRFVMIWVKFYKSIWYEKRLKTTNPDNASYRDLFIILRRSITVF